MQTAISLKHIQPHDTPEHQRAILTTQIPEPQTPPKLPPPLIHSTPPSLTNRQPFAPNAWLGLARLGSEIRIGSSEARVSESECFGSFFCLNFSVDLTNLRCSAPSVLIIGPGLEEYQFLILFASASEREQRCRLESMRRRWACIAGLLSRMVTFRWEMDEKECALALLHI
jgi:hypothetical protein